MEKFLGKYILQTKHNKKTSEVGFTADEKSTEIAVF